jgi:tryptophan halogenase
MGLSSGFVEPLESTAIMSVELQARWLAATLPSTDFEEPMIEQFNGASGRLYDEIRDFLCLHFGLNERDEPYWKAARHEAKKSDSLKHHLELWKYTLPSPLDPRNRAVFSHWSIMCILMGKNFYRECKLLDTEAVSETLWQNYWNQLTSAKQRVLGRLAGHRQLVDQMVKVSVPGASVTKQEDDGRLIGDGQLLVNPQPIMAQRAPN